MSDRVPYSQQAERDLLASMCMDMAGVMPLCEERAMQAEWFFVPAHQIVAEHLLAMWQARKAVDFTTLGQRISDAGQLEAVGGLTFLSDITSGMPTTGMAGQYLAIIEEKWTLRRIRQLCIETAARCDATGVVPAELLDTFQAAACGITRPGAELTGTATSIGQGMMDALNAIEEAYKNRGKITGIPTGLTKLDAMVMGFKGPQLIVMAGRPGMGKSAVLLNTAESAARAGFGVLIYTLEMSVQELAQRFVGSVAEVDLQRFKDGYLKEGDIARISSVILPNMNLPMWLYATPGLSIQDLRAHARAFRRTHPNLGAIFVDYLQLMRSTTRRAQDNRALELAEISGGLKRLAGELNIPIFAGAQLNRDAEEGRVPKLSQLRESGAIEQDADVVILLHRPGYHADTTGMDPEEARALQEQAMAIVAKQRNGPVGDVPLRFVGKYTRFLDADLEQTGEQRRFNAGRQKQKGQREYTDHAKRD